MHHQPTVESLRQRPLPDWFDRAKFGLLIHWGPYSVPAWAEKSGTMQELWAKRGPRFIFKHNPYAEWYLNTIHVPGSGAQRHHIETYGPNFTYDDFIPKFNAASATADFSTWADLFARAGARYVVLTTKHHDGFLLWPSQRASPPKPYYQSTRDLVGDLTGAVRARGLRMGLYYSGGYDKLFNPTVIRDLLSAITAVPQSRDYADYCDAHIGELIERYRPSILWNDIAYPATSDLQALFARYYNLVPDGVVNERWTQFRSPAGLRGAMFAALIRGVCRAWPLLPQSWRRLQMRPASHHDFTTPEYEVYDKAQPKKWEAVRGLGTSFGNNRDEGDDDMLCTEDLVRLFVDIVSKNGNLMLGIAPESDGTFREAQKQRLLELGDWLAVNGEAVFDTRPWVRAEGRTEDGLSVRFTCNEQAVFATVLGSPTGTRMTIEDLTPPHGAQLHLLGHGQPLAWQSQGERLVITLPDSLPASPAHAFRISPPPRLPSAI